MSRSDPYNNKTMILREIYKPIKRELDDVEKTLERSLKSFRNELRPDIGTYLLEAKGKRLRPALVLLSAKSTRKPDVNREQLINIAASMELVHMASLIHDDVIDRAGTRYSRPTVNSKWGADISIALGDYLYSVAFELVAEFGSADMIRAVSSATRAMCEGEFLQVSERENLDLVKKRYLVIIKKKTASLFIASCHCGTLVSGSALSLQEAFKGYGLNLGIAFQISDDYLDITADERKLGKAPGQDIAVGEVTLPLLHLVESLPGEKKSVLIKTFNSGFSPKLLPEIQRQLGSSGAASKTRKLAKSYVKRAKNRISILPDSEYKESLLSLADFVVNRAFI